MAQATTYINDMMGGGLGRSLKDNAGTLQKLRVIVEQGVFANASAYVDGAAFSVGASTNNAIVLLGSELKPVHFSVSSAQIPFLPARITAVEGAIVVDGKTALEPGQWTSARLPVNITAGTARLRVERPVTSRLPVRRIAAVAALFMGVWFAGGFIADTVIPTTGSIVTAAWNTKPASMSRNEPAKRRPVQTNYADTIKQMKDKLAQLGLLALVHPTESGARSVLVSGVIGSDEAERWRDFLRWYDAGPDRPPLLNNVTRLEGTSAMPVVTAIMFGNDPSALLASGKEVRPGDTFTDGWKVHEIKKTSVVIKRGGDEVFVVVGG